MNIKLVRMVLDHLVGKPGMIEEIMKYRKCKEARAYQIVNEVIHAAIGIVPRPKDRNYNERRHPNLIGYGLRVRYSNGRDHLDPDTPAGFYRQEIDKRAIIDEWTDLRRDTRLSMIFDLKP